MSAPLMRPSGAAASSRRHGRVRFGGIWVDALLPGEALDELERLVEARRGGAVFTPNVDHVVLAESDAALRSAYGRADLSLCDGQPLRWASPIVGLRVPAKVSGSDLLVPVLQRAARRGWSVYLLGGAPGVAAEAAALLPSRLGVEVAGHAAPRIGLDPLPDEAAILDAVATARPDLLLVCLGCPKGERFADRARARLGATVSLSLGAALDFHVGRVRRAPPWMQRAGLEWLFRLVREPRRLARRYLVRDPRFLAILWRTLRLPRRERVRPPDPPGAAATG